LAEYKPINTKNVDTPKVSVTSATDRLGVDKIGKLLWEFSVPAVIGMLVNAIYNIVDRIYLGHLGGEAGNLAIGAIGVIMPIMLTIAALSILIGVGANSLFSIRMGEGRSDEVERIMGHAFVLLFLIPAIGIAGCFIFFKPLLIHVLKVTPEMYPYSAAYLRIILYGAIFAAMSPGITNFIRSDGHPKTSMLVQVVGAVANIILDPIFIFGFDMGVAGAAWATIISQFLSLVFVMGYFNSKYTRLRFRPRYMRLTARLTGEIIAIGFAPFIMQFAMSLVGVFQNAQIIRYGGNDALTCMTIVFSFNTMVFMPMQGIGQGMQPILGYNYGAKKFRRVRRCFNLALLACTAFLTLGWLLTHLVPDLCFRMFSPDTGKLRELGVRTLRICTLMFPVISMQIMGGQFFQSIGKPVQGTVIALSRQFLYFLPMLYGLPVLWQRLGWSPVEGIFWSFPFSDVLSVITALTFITWQFRKWKKEDLFTGTQGNLN
jgi:putative MATE family efflux protein